MKILSEQKSRSLAEKYGWSLDFAQGFVKGESSRRSGARLSPYAMVGLEDYCLGFRAGYFERRNPAAMPVQNIAAPEPAVHNARRGITAAASTAAAFKPEFAY
jgi:hypothetical protein